MPYSDPQKKLEWEQEHRSQRLSRRRELRRIEAARIEAQPEMQRQQGSGAEFVLPLIAGGALAAYNPRLAIGAGGVTLVVAAAYKKGWSWRIVGALILAVGLLFQWNSSEKRQKK
jgi:hypothetical protein